MKAVMLSIRPEWCENIAQGRKTIELRSEMANADIAEQMSCVRREKILEYSGGKEVFGWHISKLKIYDTPKELCEFYKPCIKEAYPWCLNCERGLTEEERLMHIYNRIVDIPCDGWLKRPPQSWCYVEET